jgi:anti-sigma factor ChrR (cupin superfamily)
MAPLDLRAIAAHPERLAWGPFRPGVRAHWIYEGAAGACALLWYEPGAGVPLHEHPGWEHITVLSGAQEDDRGRYEAGSFVVNGPGTRHAVRCPQGALVLVVWSQRVTFL